MIIDFTIICTVRPELLKRTLDSLKSCCHDWSRINKKAIVNIDPVPANDIMKKQELINIIDDTFIAKWIIAETADFSKAVINTWKFSENEYIFHLEDDWEFTNMFSLEEITFYMTEHKIQYVRLPKERAPFLDRLALQPSIWSGKTARDLSQVMIPGMDPEKQLRYGVDIKIDEELKKIKFIDWPHGPYCRDIGREWRDGRKIKKEKGRWIFPIPGICPS